MMTDDDIRALMEGATPGPWWPCRHLRSPQGDIDCPCGYRGGIWGGDLNAVVCEMGSTDTDDGMSPARYDRPAELANAALIAAAPDLAAECLARGARIDDLERDLATAIAESEGGLMIIAAERAEVLALRARVKRLEEVMAQIASCRSVIDGDVVSIAKAAISARKALGEPQ